MKHWLVLSSALIVFGLSFILSAAIVFFSYEYYCDMNDWKGAEANKFGIAEKQYTEFQERSDILNHSNLKKFNQLIDNRFFVSDDTFSVEEQRLEMFNNLKKQLSQFPLFTANYTVSETKLYNLQGIEIDERFKIYQTEFTLKMTLLHEEDLLNLIESIRLKGLFTIKSCDIQRLHETIAINDISKANIKAICILSWYVMR
jgi:hypothetical protein